MPLPGNPNTLRHAQAGWGRPPKAPAPAADPVLESRLRHEQRWPELTVQVFDEPAHLAPVHLAPPSHLRLLLLLSGTMRLHLGSRGRTLTHLARAGMAKLTTPHHPAYEMHWTALTAAPVRTGHLYLPPTLLARTAEAAGLNPDRVELTEGNAIVDPVLFQLGSLLTQPLATALAPDRLFAESATQLLAAHLLRRHCAFTHELAAPRGKLSSQQLGAVRDYVRAHLAGAIRLDELAALAHLSAYHFCRVFKRTTGLTPAQFVTQQRLARAAELLRAGGLSVKQVAAAVGYTSHAHFTKLFARHLGRLPRDSR